MLEILLRFLILVPFPIRFNNQFGLVFIHTSPKGEKEKSKNNSSGDSDRDNLSGNETRGPVQEPPPFQQQRLENFLLCRTQGF